MSHRVLRDAWGIPHIRADSLAELAWAQGHVTALDRCWQIELERLRGEGRVSSVIGAVGLDWDRFSRQAQLRETAQAAYVGLDAETRRFLTAYVEGVNAAFEAGTTAPELAERGRSPGRWQPWTPLVVFWVQHVLFASFPTKLLRGHLSRHLGPAVAELFGPDEQHTSGSNAFAVGPGRTASGFPLIAGDPHRLFEAPNVYQQIQLACPEFDVAGLCFPGVPGIQHFGHAGPVAWAVTNACADYQDLHVERPEDLESRVEQLEVAGAGPVPVRIDRGRHGPVIATGPDGPISLRTPAAALGDLGFGALLPLLRSRSVDDVVAAFEHWVEPVNNVVIADRAGRVAHQVVGRVPRRDPRHWAGPMPPGCPSDTDWAGWVGLPGTEVPADGVQVTANDRGSAAYDVLGRDFAPPHRRRRIETLLASRQTWDPGQAARVLTDHRLDAAGVLLDLIGQVEGLSGSAAGLQRDLMSWDRAMAATSEQATGYARVREQVAGRLADHLDVPGHPYGRFYDPWFDLRGRIASALPAVLRAAPEWGLDPLAIVRDALLEVGMVPAAPWGEQHRFAPMPGLAFFGLAAPDPAPAGTPLAGDDDCVAATSRLPGSVAVIRGSVARYVWDLHDRDSSRWAVPLGASGLGGSEHESDQFAAWLSGELVPMITDWSRLEESS